MPNTYWGSAAAGILFFCEEDNTILLGLRSFAVMNPHKWGIPGGSVSEEGLIASDAVRTQGVTDQMFWEGACVEVEEECGGLPHLMDKQNVIFETTFEDRNFRYRTFVYKLTLAEKLAWQIFTNWENDEFEWFTLHNLPKNLHSGVRYTLDLFIRKNPQPKEHKMSDKVGNIVLQKQMDALEYLAQMYEVEPLELLNCFEGVRSNPITKHTDEFIIEALKRGATPAQLYRQFRTEAVRVDRLKSKMGDFQKIQTSISDADLKALRETFPAYKPVSVTSEFIADAYKKGARFSQLGRLFQISMGRIYDMLNEQNVVLQDSASRRRLKGLSDDEIIRMYADYTGALATAPMEVLEEQVDAEAVAEEVAARELESDPHAQEEIRMIVVREVDDPPLITLSQTAKTPTPEMKSHASSFVPKAYEAGANFLSLAEFCKLSTARIREYLVSANTPIRSRTDKRKVALSQQDIQAIWENFLVETNQILEQVAAEAEIDKTLVIETSFEDLNRDNKFIERIRKNMETLVRLMPLVERFEILLLRQKGLSYADIQREVADLYLKRKVKPQLSVIAYIIDLGFPKSIDMTAYQNALRTIEAHLAKGSRRKVRLAPNSAEPFHYIEELFDLTPADTEFIIYLNQKYDMNLFEINLFVYQMISVPQLRELFAYFGITPTRSRMVDIREANKITDLREIKKYSVKTISEITGIKPVKVMFFIDYRKLNADKVYTYTSNGVWTGNETTFIDPVRDISGSVRNQIIQMYRTDTSSTAESISRQFAYTRISPQDVRSLLYVRDVPLRIKDEFPTPTTRPQKEPPLIRQPSTIPIVYQEPLPIVREIAPPRELEVSTLEIPISDDLSDLFPIEGLSLLDIERIVDLNQTFCLTTEEIQRFEFPEVTEDDILKAFKYAQQPYKKCSEVTKEKANRILKSMARTTSLQHLADIFQQPLEKIKYLIRKKYLKARTSAEDPKAYDYVTDAFEILGTNKELQLEMCDAYQSFNSAEIAYTLGFASRKDVRRILHECVRQDIRLREEFTLVEDLEAFGN